MSSNDPTIYVIAIEAGLIVGTALYWFGRGLGKLFKHYLRRKEQVIGYWACWALHPDGYRRCRKPRGHTDEHAYF